MAAAAAALLPRSDSLCHRHSLLHLVLEIEVVLAWLAFGTFLVAFFAHFGPCFGLSPELLCEVPELSFDGLDLGVYAIECGCDRFWYGDGG